MSRNSVTSSFCVPRCLALYQIWKKTHPDGSDDQKDSKSALHECVNNQNAGVNNVPCGRNMGFVLVKSWLFLLREELFKIPNPTILDLGHILV